VATEVEILDAHRADEIDPLALLRCQIDASEVEREGEELTLNEHGLRLSEADFQRRAESGNDLLSLLTVNGHADPKAKDGDPLEYAAAAVALKLGVRRVRRSLRLKVRSTAGVSTRMPHAEIDLMFNFGGRLWVVDCKDRRPTADLLKPIEACLHKPTPAIQEHLSRLRAVLSISETKALKEDMLAVREAGGLLGQVVCVRKAEPPDEVKQFAKHNQIEIIPKSHLFSGWKSLLNPSRPASEEQLKDLASSIGRK
jgi:hypothetical protein